MNNSNNIYRKSYDQYVTDSSKKIEFNTAWIVPTIVLGWIGCVIGFFVYLFTL